MSSSDNEQGDNGGKIAYSIRSLLERMDSKLDRMNEALDAKASRSVVETLQAKVAIIETTRQTEREYGQALLSEYRKGQETQAKQGERITVLETQSATKRQLALAWVPSALTVVGFALYYIKYH